MGNELKWLLKEGVGVFLGTLSLENRPTPFKNRPTLLEIKPTQELMSGEAAKEHATTAYT